MANWTYKDLRFYEWILEELKKTPGSNPEYFEELVIEEKRKLRRSNRVVNNERKIVRDYGMDGVIVKFPLPEELTSAEEADEYFREYEYIYFYPSPYDCTGQQFTSWYKIFRKPDGRFWAYHSIGVDI